MEMSEPDGEEYERGRVDTELGFVKYDGEWTLTMSLGATRRIRGAPANAPMSLGGSALGA